LDLNGSRYNGTASNPEHYFVQLRFSCLRAVNNNYFSNCGSELHTRVQRLHFDMDTHVLEIIRLETSY